jgi:ribosomal protein S18 acetylase RimI-like enzyme
MVVRELALGDARAIENVRQFRAREAAAAHSPMASYDWTQFFSQSGHHAWGMLDDGLLVGTLFLMPDPRHPNHVFIQGLWVAELHRGQGIGHQLLQAAVSYADAECYRMVKLWVAENNLTAKTLYRELDFRPTGRLRAAAYDPFHHMQQFVLDLRHETAGSALST